MPLPTTTEVFATDKSSQILDSLFGRNWSLWGTGDLAGAEGTSTNLMFQLFEAFNMVALVCIAGLFLFYVLIAVVGSAHEGTPLGKKYSAFWVPVRFVCAVGALSPLFKGLSLFQVAILALIGWSINIGNYVYDLSSSYFLKHTGEFQVQNVSNNEYLHSITNDMLKSLTIQAYLQNERGLSNEVGSSSNWKYHKDWFSSAGEWEYIFTGVNGKRDALGSLSIICSSEKTEILNLCHSNKVALENALSSLIPLATALADPNTVAENINPSVLYTVERKLSADIMANVNQYINSNQNFKNKLTSYHNATDELGWISAGATYWAIAWINQETKNLMTSNIASSFFFNTKEKFLSDTFGLTANEGVIQRVDNFIATGYSSLKSIDDFNSFSESDGSGFLISVLSSVINSNFNLNTFIKNLETQDPIMLLSQLGNSMINWAIGIYLTLTGASFFAQFPAIGKTVEILTSFGLYAITIPLFLYGIYLAFYLPSIPFIRWISGIFGWLILIVEGLIATPLWVASHALPEGDGFAGTHAKRGYFLLLGIVIRPPLMVAGFFIAIILINIIGQVIGTLFSLLFNTVSDYAIGLTGTMSFIIILGTVLIMVANKIFCLITWLPDHITNWIGQQLHSLGEDRDVDVSKGSFTGSTQVVSALRPSPSPVVFSFKKNGLQEANLS